MKHRLLNLCLRGGGMAGKFLLIFFLARVLSPQELGTYGLLVSTVSYALYFLGLDFYTYSGRAMLQTEQNMWPAMLRDQAALFVCSYIVVFPLLGVLFLVDFLPVKFATVFYILLLVEHLSQELNRLLVMIGKPLAAGGILFVRTGAWCYAVAALYWAGYATSIELHSIIWLWIAADAIVVLYGAWSLRKLPWQALKPGVNWVWIGKGFSVASMLLLGTLALRGLLTVDRYIVNIYAGLEMLGVYTLYMGICFSLIGFVDAVVFSFHYPKLVSLYKATQDEPFKAARRDLTRQTLVLVFLLATLMILMVVPVLAWTGKAIYLQNIHSFFILLLASIVYVIGHIPHYVLYAMGHDRSIAGAHIVGLLVFAASCAVLVPLKSLGMTGVALALLVSVVVLWAVKQWQLSKISRHGLVC